MRLLLISSSNVHGYGYLDHAEPEIRRVLEGCETVSFLPFAGKDHDAYTTIIRDRLGRMGFDVSQVRERKDVDAAEAIMVGGGNTFRLLNELYARGLIGPIRERVRAGTLLYIGSSAGTNIAAPTIKTTNDMPILEPPSFDALALVPFQINPHYQDPDPSSTHKGETREERIREFHEENAPPVAGLREGAWLRVEGPSVWLEGSTGARVFQRGTEPVEFTSGSRLDFLLSR